MCSQLLHDRYIESLLGSTYKDSVLHGYTTYTSSDVVRMFVGRLWAEIFEVQENEGDVCWAAVSTDVVPVNITCIQDSPEIIFQITAYNRHVEKIFDVKLIQPGM